MITLEFEKAKGLPAAARFAYVADDFSEAFVFYPTDTRGRRGAYLAAAFDGVGLLRGHKRQFYFPLGWLAREYPEQKDGFEAMKRKLVERAQAGEAAQEESPHD